MRSPLIRRLAGILALSMLGVSCGHPPTAAEPGTSHAPIAAVQGR